MRFRRRAQKKKRERGSALIEAAFVTPVFLLLLFGVFEFGFLFRNYLTLANATTEGARTASVAGRAEDADFIVLRAVEHGMSAWGLENIEYVVVYEAANPGDAMPAGCDVASIAGVCNHYTKNSFFHEYLDDVTGLPTGSFGCGAGSIDSNWCPDDRQAALSDPPDYVGVHIAVRHDYMTGFIGDSRILTNTKVIRIEPERH